MVTARHFKTALYRFTAFHLDWPAFYTCWVTLTPKQGPLSYSGWEYSLMITSTHKVSGYTIKPAACIPITRRLAYQHASKKLYWDKKYFSDAAAQIIPQQNMEELGNAKVININQTTSSSLIPNHQPSTFLLPVCHKAGEWSSTSRILGWHPTAFKPACGRLGEAQPVGPSTQEAQPITPSAWCGVLTFVFNTVPKHIYVHRVVVTVFIYRRGLQGSYLQWKYCGCGDSRHSTFICCCAEAMRHHVGNASPPELWLYCWQNVTTLANQCLLTSTWLFDIKFLGGFIPNLNSWLLISAQNIWHKYSNKDLSHPW